MNPPPPAVESTRRRRELPPLTGIGIVAAALFLIYELRIVLLPFVVAGALAFVASPVVEWIRRRLRVPRQVAAVLVFVLFLAVLTCAGIWARHVLVPELSEFARLAPDRLRQLFRQFAGSDRARFLGSDVTADDLIQSMLGSLQQWIGGPFAALAGAMLAIVTGFLTLVLLFFFLFSTPRLARGILRLVPPGRRPAARRIAAQIGPILRRYIVGVIVVVIATSILSWIGIGLLLHLPQAVMLSILIGVLEAVPVIGPILSATLLSLVAVTRGGAEIVVGVALFVLSIRLFIDQVMGPIILGRAVRLHPAAVIFAFVVGGTLFGLLGFLVAVPAAAMLVVVLRDLYGESPPTPAP